MTIGEKIDSTKDKLKGKANKIVGEVRGDKEQKEKGQLQGIKGDLEELESDIKESFKDR